ncbi:hypothetical protein R1sor_007250 [Riccia sorocarpa]|uniref:Uncharacterized protein n=1 Tax=Riccia sorocarpa TaxID=122646 RepID=A0ABD3HTD1_9MARC
MATADSQGSVWADGVEEPDSPAAAPEEEEKPLVFPVSTGTSMHAIISLHHGLCLVTEPPEGQLGLPMEERYQYYEYILAMDIRALRLLPTMGAVRCMLKSETVQAILRRRFELLRFEDAISVRTLEERLDFLGLDELSECIERSRSEAEAGITIAALRPSSPLNFPFHFKVSCLLTAPGPPSSPPLRVDERAFYFYTAILHRLLERQFVTKRRIAFVKVMNVEARERIWNQFLRLRYEEAIRISSDEDIDAFLGLDDIFGLKVQTEFRDYQDYRTCLVKRLLEIGVAWNFRDAFHMVKRRGAYFKRRFEELPILRRNFTTMAEYDTFLGLDKLSEHPGESLTTDRREADDVPTVVFVPSAEDGLPPEFFRRLAFVSRVQLIEPTAELDDHLLIDSFLMIQNGLSKIDLDQSDMTSGEDLQTPRSRSRRKKKKKTMATDGPLVRGSTSNTEGKDGTASVTEENQDPSSERPGESDLSNQAPSRVVQENSEGEGEIAFTVWKKAKKKKKKKKGARAGVNVRDGGLEDINSGSDFYLIDIPVMVFLEAGI